MKIYAALAKFAKECPSVPKDSENPHFRSKYASLSKIQEVIKKPLEDSGIVLVHSVTMNGVTSTAYCVEDDSSVSSTFPFTVGNPQQNGSAVTYAKRYNTAALFNLDTDADDDANVAQGSEKEANRIVFNKPTAEPRTFSKEEPDLPWMDEIQLDAILRSIEKGGYDGKNGQDVVRHIRTKFKVNREMAAKIDTAVSKRPGNY